jgi:putative flippase GtrA
MGQISRLIDFFYPPFSPYISRQLFRYAACGGGNLVFDWVLYFLIYNFVFEQKNDLHLGLVTLSPYIASFAITFPVTLLTGFLLQKYITFTTSSLRGRVQLFRYFLVVIANILIIYTGLKIMVDGFGFWATPSKMLVTVFTIIFSYLSQKKFTFKSDIKKS